MKSKALYILLFSSIFLGLALSSAWAIEVTRTPTGVLKYDTSKAKAGYTLLPAGPKVRLMDMNGVVVHEWNTGGGGDAKITKQGTLFRSSGCGAVDECDENPLNWGGTQGRLREWAWDGTLLWDVDLATKDWIQHHTFHPTSYGTVLVLIWERYSRDEAIWKGRDPMTVNPEGTEGDDTGRTTYNGDLWPDAIIEIAKKGESVPCEDYEVVWSWHAWDHLCSRNYWKCWWGCWYQDNNPHCIDINYHIPRPTATNHRASADFMHVNAIDYMEECNLVVLTSRIFGEFYLIDKASGEIRYRWGNPSAWTSAAHPPSYMNNGDTQLFGPHGTHAIGSCDGGKANFIIFDNGWLRPEGNFSRAVEVEVDFHNPDFFSEPEWTYQTDSANSLNSPFVSYAQRFKGNTIITSGGEGHIIEVCPDGKVVWEYVLPGGTGCMQCENIDGEIGGFMFRSYRYAPDYEGLGPLDIISHYPFPDYSQCPCP
jgi:hypothetical protein